jgi:peptidyl-prolyl cis-trans isomerase-like protein 2
MFLNFHSFITYRSCKHLDNKHTIFGRVVGGIETLSAMEAVGTDNQVFIVQ